MRISNKYWFLIIAFVFFFSNENIAQQQFVLKSDYLSAPDTSIVFLPNQQSQFSREKLPLVIMLHGYGGNYKQWSKVVDLQEFANKYNCIIACPDGLKDSWYFDSPIQRDSKFESFFIEKYLPYLKENFQVDTNGIFITGLSMGGHGALYLFLRHPELFASAGSTSGTLDLNYSSLKYSSLSDKLGEYNDNIDRFNKYSCINNLEKIKFSEKPIIFDCGNLDHLYQANKKFKQKCDSLRINAFYFSFPGRHNRMYWRKSIEYHFIYFHRIYLNGLED